MASINEKFVIFENTTLPWFFHVSDVSNLGLAHLELSSCLEFYYLLKMDYLCVVILFVCMSILHVCP